MKKGEKEVSKTKAHKDKAKELKEVSDALVSGKDALVVVNIFSPDCKAKEYKMYIPNIVHSCPPTHREPSYIAGILLGALKGKYGNKVK